MDTMEHFIEHARMNTEPVWVGVKRLHPDAQLPRRGTPESAGFDLFCIEGGNIWHGDSAVFRTGIALEIPAGYYGDIRSRSGLAFKHSVEKGAGTIDSDYRGEVKIKLYNHSREGGAVKIQAGERIAQIIIKKLPNVLFKEMDELSTTDRGEGGFGSTGRR